MSSPRHERSGRRALGPVILGLLVWALAPTGPASAATIPVTTTTDGGVCGAGTKDTGKGGPGKDRAKRCEKGTP